MTISKALKTACIAPALAMTAFLGVARGETLNQIKVQPDKAPDCTSIKSIVASVTRDCKTNDDRAIAIYNFCNLSHYHLAYPNEKAPIPALKEINVYGWSLCGGLHTIESALWIEQGWDYRYVGWSNPGHTTVEANYDGKWHYLDVFLKFYAWMPDGKGGRTIAGQEDLKANSQGLLTDAFVMDPKRNVVYAKADQFVMNGDKANWEAPSFLGCGDEVKGVVSGVNSRHVAGHADVWGTSSHLPGNYTADVNLGEGMAMTNTWDPAPGDFYWNGGAKPPAHTCPSHKDTRNDPAFGLVLEPYVSTKKARSYGTGTLNFQPDLSSPTALKAFESAENAKLQNGALVPADAGKPGSVVVKLMTPYMMTGVSASAAEGIDKVAVSTDGGKTFADADIAKIGESLKGNQGGLVKLTFSHPVKSIQLSVDFENNPGALPYLSPGKNVVAISAANAAALGSNKLVVTYAYQLGARSQSFEQICEKGKDIGRDGATWSDTVTYVQKTFTAKDLPANIEVDCPTPKGQYAAYPRMVMMRREIVSPTGKPLPLPDGAVEAKMGPNDELQTLPNPFLIGTQPPLKTAEASTVDRVASK